MDGWSRARQPEHRRGKLQGPRPADEGVRRGQVDRHCPHRLVVMRLPLTKVVEVETERKPSPASAPELNDEAKKSGERSDKVTARVGARGRQGTDPEQGHTVSWDAPDGQGLAASPT